MANKKNTTNAENVVINETENVVERSETMATLENGTTVEKNATYKVIGNMECTILSTNTNEQTLADLETARETIEQMDIMISTGRACNYKFFNLLREFKEKELYKLFKNPDKPKQAFRNVQEWAKFRYGIAQTLCNNGILVSEKFFNGTDNGILINGRPAIEYGQTALIELLPVMASKDDDADKKKTKDTEREKVFAEISPFSKVKDIKSTMEKYHAKKEIVTANKENKDKKADTPTSVLDLLESIIDLFSKAYAMPDINDFSDDEKKKLDGARLEINAVLQAKKNA